MILDFILHFDRYIDLIIQNYGVLVYFVLFLIIFLETGLVIAPFLPGDSLIFVAGAIAARGDINIIFLFIILSSAAILGDSLNYWIGNYFGERIFTKSRLIKKEHLDKTKEFYRKHGGKTIILARFIPIIRTFAPFVAGIGKMNYKRFFLFNITGGIIWVFIFLLGGYFLGRIEFIKNNLSLVIIAIIIISVIPVIVEYLRNKYS